MGELAARTLHDTDASRLIIMNRTHAHAIDLAQRLGATTRAWTELANALREADVVISATAAQEAILTFDLLQQVMRQRAGRFLLLIDLALPRDIDPAVVRLPDVRLYNLDDLQASAQAGLYLRMQEVERVQAIIATEACAFDHWLRSLSVSDAICALRQHAESLRQQELKRTLQQLASSLSEQEVAAITALSTRLVNKLLHTPTVRLKEATATDQAQVYAQALRYLFALGKTLGQDERLDRGNGEAGL
jgi:glutamyl-tRNA reductase